MHTQCCSPSHRTWEALNSFFFCMTVGKSKSISAFWIHSLCWSIPLRRSIAPIIAAMECVPGCQKVEHIRTNLYNLLSSSIESSHPSLNSNRYKYPKQAVTVKLFLFAFNRLLDFFSDWLALRLPGAQNRSAVGIKSGIIVKRSDRTRTERIDEVQWGFFHRSIRQCGRGRLKYLHKEAFTAWITEVRQSFTLHSLPIHFEESFHLLGKMQTKILNIPSAV